jgi:HD superfamily phosphohydrolase
MEVPMAWRIDDIMQSIRSDLRGRDIPDDSIPRHITYHAAVLQELEKRYGRRYPTATFRGMGGSGVVLKLGFTKAGRKAAEGDLKCVKYPLPMIEQFSFSLASVLDNEAKRLKDLHHQYIVPLEEVDKLTLKSRKVAACNRQVPFYLMPYVESINLFEYLAGPRVTIETLLKILHQVAQAVRYIHQAGFVHLDIKPENIFVKNPSDSNTSALLADFGFCKKVKVGSRVQTLVIGTEEYMHPELLARMRNRTTTERRRTRDNVQRRFLDPRFDRYSFGVTIANSLHAYLKPTSKETSWRPIPVRILRGLQFVVLRCSDGHPQEMRATEDRAILLPDCLFKPEIATAFRYIDTEEFCRNLGTLAQPLGAYEMEEELADTGSHSICVPPRTFVPASARVRGTLDCAAVRRLAGLTQLALCYHVFPGAAHTRKEHVIGTYQTVARLLRHLLLDPSNPLCALLLTQRHQRLILLSSLLHDISHVPLMHEFEDTIPELDQERYNCEILDGKWGGAALKKEIAAVLKLWGVGRDDLQVVLGKKEYCLGPKKSKGGGKRRSSKEMAWNAMWEQPDYEFAKSLLDGGLDADKVDYLQRDAMHAGVQFGSGVDVERLELTSTAALWLEGGKTTKARCRFAASKKGQVAAEGVIGVRHAMYSQVYAHKTVRAARAMLNFITWRWRLSKCHNNLSGGAIADRLFAFASRLETSQAQLDLFGHEQKKEFEPTIYDNLPYPDARVIRWMAHSTGDSQLIDLGEAIITRHLYKEVCVLKESDVEDFLNIAFPLVGETRVRASTALSANEWIELTDFLSRNVRIYLNEQAGKLTQAITSEQPHQAPEVLVDVALPKTMRTQTALTIVSDVIGQTVGWRRLQNFAQEGVGAQLGLSIERSPVYEIYGGSSAGNFVSKVSVRLFARPDLAGNLRTHLNPQRFADWLNSYRPQR